MAPSSPSVVIFAGPSGGHLFPAYAFGQRFKKRSPAARLHLVTSEKGRGIASRFTPGIFEGISYWPNFPSPSGISLRLLDFLLKLLRAFILSFRCLSKLKPDFCVGFGSYVSYPGIVVSSWMKIPTLIHEQNLVPGKATRWLTGHADLMAVTFEETFSSKSLRRPTVTGLPIREDLCQAAFEAAQLRAVERKEIFRILIVGGSQGARTLNETILRAWSRLSAEEKREIAVIHITGNADFETARRAYREIGVGAEVFAFVDNMQEIYGRVDMALTRAGANTLFELALFGLPAIVIPYPFAGAHQSANARSFEANHAIIFRPEKIFTVDWLLEQIRNLKTDPGRCRALSDSIRKLARPEAAERLCDLAQTLLRG